MLRLFVLLTVALAQPGVARPRDAPTNPVAAQQILLSDATATSGIAFEHRHGGTGERYMVETMGSGLALVDIDNDGRVDTYLVQQGATPSFVTNTPLIDRLYRNDGSSFRDATTASQLVEEGYGIGVAAADYDNDGFADLYVTNFGANSLWRNNGDGTFSRADEADTSDDQWGSSAGWGDFDGDGDLDLYVANYVDFGWDNNKFCGDAGRQISAYCHPDVYNALADRLYENRADGTFVEIGAIAGIADTIDGKGLGVVWGDYDDDGDPDIYVANDSTRNFLYTNQGDGTFVDDSFLAGVGYSEDGRTQAGMGTDFGDYDADGDLDLIVTNLTLETNTLYRNLGNSAFIDHSYASGIGEPSLLLVGFGTNWFDVDADGDLDLFVANGHIIDNIAEFREGVAGSALAERTYPQPNHLFINNGGGRFAEAHATAGSGMGLVKVSRGSVVGDVDNDGDLDVVVSNSNQTADYLRNDTVTGNWIQLRLVGRQTNRNAVGARVEVTPASTGGGSAVPAMREVVAGASYASTNDLTLHIGLGDASSADLTIRWPGGDHESLSNLTANRRFVIQEGRGVIAWRPKLGG
ncbi:MAG TPA: CRTAC1 family protein [Acidobacteriota bacterium]|nr:CRTAC1 family protein [Acidobacteriota bacterium]